MSDEECPHCKRPDGAVNWVPGCIFVGAGHGWQTCIHCNGTQRTQKCSRCSNPGSPDAETCETTWCRAFREGRDSAVTSATPRFPTAADAETRNLIAMICSKGCGKVFLYAPDDREQRLDENGRQWIGFVRCPCGVERCISVGSFREDYRPATPFTRSTPKDPNG